MSRYGDNYMNSVHKDSKFNNVNLTKASFMNSEHTNSVFKDVDMTNAKFNNTKFMNYTFDGVKIPHVVMIDANSIIGKMLREAKKMEENVLRKIWRTLRIYNDYEQS